MYRVLGKYRNIFKFTSNTSKINDFGFSDDYEILNVLGKGSSARVFLGINVITHKKVVIKMFKNLPQESIKKEISINKILLRGLN
jgi:serine/threonine protein kinase